MRAKARRRETEVDVHGPSAALEELLRTGGAEVDRALVRRADVLAAIYFDSDLTRRNEGSKALLRTLVAEAIDDLSDGAPVLTNNALGLALANDQLRSFVVPHGTAAPGSVLFCLELRTRPAGAPALLDEDLACALIYRLIVFSALESAS